MQQYMEKAVHEAKINVSWLNPNPEYVAGIREFITAILSPTYRGKSEPVLGFDAEVSAARAVFRRHQLTDANLAEADLSGRS